MHGIFPTHNKYYLATEIFPHLSKKEIKEVYYPERKPRETGLKSNHRKPKVVQEDEE